MIRTGYAGRWGGLGADIFDKVVPFPQITHIREILTYANASATAAAAANNCPGVVSAYRAVAARASQLVAAKIDQTTQHGAVVSELKIALNAANMACDKQRATAVVKRAQPQIVAAPQITDIVLPNRSASTPPPVLKRKEAGLLGGNVLTMAALLGAALLFGKKE